MDGANKGQWFPEFLCDVVRQTLGAEVAGIIQSFSIGNKMAPCSTLQKFGFRVGYVVQKAHDDCFLEFLWSQEQTKNPLGQDSAQSYISHTNERVILLCAGPSEILLNLKTFQDEPRPAVEQGSVLGFGLVFSVDQESTIPLLQSIQNLTTFCHLTVTT